MKNITECFASVRHYHKPLNTFLHSMTHVYNYFDVIDEEIKSQDVK